jgi:hypothetical protein
MRIVRHLALIPVKSMRQAGHAVRHSDLRALKFTFMRRRPLRMRRKLSRAPQARVIRRRISSLRTH